MQINSLTDANTAIEHGLLIRIDSDGPGRTTYYTTSKDGWQMGYSASAGTLGHEAVDTDDARDTITAHLESDNATVTAVAWIESPWGRDRAQGAQI